MKFIQIDDRVLISLENVMQVKRVGRTIVAFYHGGEQATLYCDSYEEVNNTFKKIVEILSK